MNSGQIKSLLESEKSNKGFNWNGNSKIVIDGRKWMNKGKSTLIIMNNWIRYLDQKRWSSKHCLSHYAIYIRWKMWNTKRSILLYVPAIESTLTMHDHNRKRLRWWMWYCCKQPQPVQLMLHQEKIGSFITSLGRRPATKTSRCRIFFLYDWVCS